MLKSVQDTANFFSDFSTATITKKKKIEKSTNFYCTIHKFKTIYFLTKFFFKFI